MKAALFKGKEQLVVTDMVLRSCGPGDIIVKVDWCGICGSDVRNFKTGLRDNVTEQVMGHEFTGVIVETGVKVNGYKVGDKLAFTPDVSCGQCYYCKRGWVNLCDNHKMVGTHWPGGFGVDVAVCANPVAVTQVQAVAKSKKE